MGVPAFYRWLSERYPKIIQDCVEDEEQWIDGQEVPVDTSRPNPNNMEFDNLYLDMNNIIHPCFHPEDRPAPTTETEVFLTMFDYMDRLFAIVRPRKLLYMAIDGVAPRAKMNQQRSRRFRAAQEREEAAEEEKRLRADFEKQGIRLPVKEESGSTWDSNIITPGTPFMHRVSVALQYYIHLRLNTDPGWRNISVILSDSNSPGEGEHKIMSYVREQRGRPGWSPSTRHCLYGLDADLIMLGLATHEPHFVILREIVTQPQRNAPVSQMHSRNDPAADVPVAKPQIAKKPYQFLLISALREYLTLEFEPPVPLPFPYDPERIVDDFVFMCFFVGNDFLPHMPTLEIREGALETLMTVYRQEQPRLGGYLTEGAKVNLDKVEYFIQTVGRFEDAIFAKRARLLASQRARRICDKEREANMKAGRGGGGRGMGGRGRNSKYTSLAPSEEYRNSLFEVGNRSKGPGMEAELNFLQQQQQQQQQDPAALTNGAVPPPVVLPPPPERPASGPGATNQSAAAALRERMRGSKRASPPADGEGAEKKVKLSDGSSAPGGPSDSQLAATEAVASTDAAAASTDAPPAASTVDAPTSAAPTSAAATDDRGSAGAASGADANAEAAKAEAGGTSVGMGEGVAPAAVKVESDVGGEVKAEEDAALNGADVAVGEDDDVNTVDSEADRLMRQEELEAEEKLAEELAVAGAAAAADLKEQLASRMKDKGDAFDTMIEAEEKIRLGEEGWKARYYQEKTGLSGEAQEEAARAMVAAYVEGLCWVMAYYYDGVASWTWFYPFHYAPFASDLRNLQELTPTFTLGEPFKPFNQLMGVLPAGSAHALPAAYQPLFTNPDSPILDFYPSDFAIDMNGKRFAWQGVCLLPFIDESRLLAAVAPCEASLTAEERFRNAKRCEQLFLASWHDLAPDIFELSDAHASTEGDNRAKVSATINPERTKGMNGELLLVGGEANPSVIPAPFDLGEDLTTNAVVAAGYRLPEHQHHQPRLLPGHVPEPRVVQHVDLPPPKPLWHEDNRRGGFHAERERRGLTGHGAARAPQGPPVRLAPGAYNMMAAGMAPPPRAGPPGPYDSAPPPRPGPAPYNPPPGFDGGGGRGSAGGRGPLLSHQQQLTRQFQQQQPYSGGGGGRGAGGGRFGGGGGPPAQFGGGRGGFTTIAAQQPAYPQFRGPPQQQWQGQQQYLPPQHQQYAAPAQHQGQYDQGPPALAANPYAPLVRHNGPPTLAPPQGGPPGAWGGGGGRGGPGRGGYAGRGAGRRDPRQR